MNKLLENEKMFARANGEITEAASRLTPVSEFPPDMVLELYCECANTKCFERFSIAYAEYKSVKGDLTFIVKPKHYLPEFEELMSQQTGYWVIVKRPEKLDKDFVV
jgi:hypothetical protein